VGVEFVEIAVGYATLQPIRKDGTIVYGPNQGARSWDVHAAADTRRKNSHKSAA
jgi:hypothetical protein